MTQHHPTTSSTLYGKPHPNNKQDKNINPIIGRQDYHLSEPWGKEKKKKDNLTSSHQNASINLTQQEAYTSHWTKLTGAEPKRNKEFNLEGREKETLNTVS